MVTRKVLRQTVGASAAVVLAAVVNAAVATPAAAQTLGVDARPDSIAGDLSWAISGASAVQNARTILAEKAVQTLTSLDRLNGVLCAPSIDCTPAFQARTETVPLSRAHVPDPASSTHQHSAP